MILELTMLATLLAPQTTPQEPPKIEIVKVNVPSQCVQYIEEINKYDWDTEIATKIMIKESGCREEVVNDNPKTGDYSVGLFQINLYGANAKERPTEEWLKNPENNIAYAYELYNSPRGFNHWTTYKKI